MGFYTNHSSSAHTFPRNRSSVNELVEEANVEETLAGSHTAVEESLLLDNKDGSCMLCWEGFMSPVENQPFEETMMELISNGHSSNTIVPSDNDEGDDAPTNDDGGDGVTFPVEDDGNKDVDGDVAVVDNVDNEIADIDPETGK